jgi:hypothetical protein
VTLPTIAAPATSAHRGSSSGAERQHWLAPPDLRRCLDFHAANQLQQRSDLPNSSPMLEETASAGGRCSMLVFLPGSQVMDESRANTTMGGVKKKCHTGRRLDQDRGCGEDTRSEEEKRLVGG